MFVAAIIGVVILIFVVALVAPRLSIWPQRRVDETLTDAEQAGSEAPGGLGRVLPKPFSASRKAVDKSADAGRKSRFKLPF